MSSENKNWKDWFTGTLKCLTDAAVFIDRDLKILFSNSRAVQLAGLGKEEIQEENLLEIFRMDDAGNSMLLSILKKVKKDHPFTFTSILISKTLKEVRVECIVSSVHNNDNDELIGYILIFKEISEGKQIVKEIKESERKYKGLFENALEGIFIIDEQSYIIDANPAACKIYGFKKEEFLKLSVKEIFPHKTKEEASAIWSGFLKVGYISGLYKFQLKSGEFNYIDFKAKTNFLPGLHLAVFSNVTEKIETEKALRLSEANLKAIFNNASQRIILLDTDLKILTVNKAAQEASMKLINKELVLGESILDYTNSKRSDSNFFSIFNRAKAGEIVVQEIDLAEDGWVEQSFIPIFDNKRNIKGICCMFIDITYRKKAQISLEESEARFRSLVQNSNDIITILDKDRRISYSSSSIEKILGHKQEEISNLDILKYVHPDDISRFTSVFNKVVMGSTDELSLEYRFEHYKGFYLHLETIFNNLFDNEHIQGVVLNSRDISERKFQEENLRLLERGIDASKNGIIITDSNQPDNPVIYTNKAFEQITGYTSNEVLGKNCRFLQKDDVSQPELDKIRTAIKQEKEASVILRNSKKNGDIFWNQLNISPVFNKAGSLTNFIGVLDDITERKLAEETLIDITQGISGISGKDFFVSLAKHLAISFDMDYVMIGEKNEEEIKTKVFLEHGTPIDNFEFNIMNTPAQAVFEKTSCLYIEGVKLKYKMDHLPLKENVFDFMGVPLIDSSGKKIGIISLMSNKRFLNKQVLETILNIFSVRASAELERDYNLSALKLSEKKFRNLAENSPDLIYIVNIDLKRAVYFNRGKVLGYNTNELEFSDIWNDIVHPDDKMEVLGHWNNFLLKNSEKPEALEYRIKRKSGEYAWVINRHTIIERKANGEPVQVLLNITIITERKNAEDALRESQARLTTLIENTSDIIWSVDNDLVITTMNSAFKKLFKNNFKKTISVGDSLKDFLPENIKEEWIGLHNKALEGNAFSTEFNLISKKQNYSYEISYNPIYSNENKRSGVSVFARDITRRKIAEDDIIKTNFELDSFVYRASHDLRAPLRSVLGLTALAKTEEDDAQRNNFLTLIDKSINKLDTFISDLTNFSRNSRLEVTSEKIDFNVILQECIENLQYMDHADRIDIRIKLDTKVDFYSDKTRLSIMMQNLISNCIKYQNTRISNSFVSIEIVSNEEKVIIGVKDNGKGIKDEYLDKIFNMFFRASQDSYGSGLGLYITKQVVEKLNGSIKVESKLGEGTSFIIILPNLAK
jgi:PAS domain S-box-containing protein